MATVTRNTFSNLAALETAYTEVWGGWGLGNAMSWAQEAYNWAAYGTRVPSVLTPTHAEAWVVGRLAFGRDPIAVDGSNLDGDAYTAYTVNKLTYGFWDSGVSVQFFGADTTWPDGAHTGYVNKFVVSEPTVGSVTFNGFNDVALPSDGTISSVSWDRNGATLTATTASPIAANFNNYGQTFVFGAWNSVTLTYAGQTFQVSNMAVDANWVPANISDFLTVVFGSADARFLFNHAPTVLVSDQQIGAGVTVLASTLLSTSDADGDSMARYRFWDGGVGGGHFNFAGTPAAAKLNLEVAAADLASVTYTGGAGAGSEVLWAQVNDGTVWSAWQSWTQTTVRTSNVLSVVSAGTDTLAPLVWRTGAQVALTISDGDGDPAVWVEFTDLTASAGSGRLWYAGSYVAANQPVVVSGANLANFWLQGGANLGSDQVQVRVNDGYGWSTPSTLTLLTKGPNHAPAVLVSAQQIVAGATVLASTLLSTSDADGDSMARYRFWDGGVGGGHFNLAGTPAAAKLNLEVAAADLASVTYTGGAVAGAEVLWAQVNDGTVWSAWQSWTQTTVRTSNVLSVVSAGTDTLAPLVWRTGAQAALTISDGDGDPAVWVEFTDLTASAGSGRLWYSGSYVAANQPVVVSGANLANFWLQGGANLGSDQVQVRVNDGYGWSTPSTLTLLTKGPNHAPAVLVSDQQIGAGTTVLASTLLSTSDADGDSMARYRFWDGGVGGGHFNFAGTPAAAKLNLEVAAADLVSVTYTGGAVAGAEVLWAQVNDGTVWGAWQSWTQTTQPMAPTAGQAVIDLGSYGKLIAPVQVDGGNWLYYWDRSGDGSSADSGSLNGGVDYASHDVLDSIFNQNIAGAVGGGGNTTDVYRYATLNGIHLALPTAGGQSSPPYGAGGIANYQPDTAVGSSPASTGSNAVNGTYNDLLAVWDAYNGTGTSASANGTPAGWQANHYWSATPSASGHASVYLDVGGVGGTRYYDNTYHYVALQVLFNDSVPVITSAASTSVAENITGTVYTVTASDADAGAVLTYSMSGTDAALFNLNAITGAVSFLAAPNYEAPADAGQDNVYNISVTASHGSQSSAAQAVAITVTDVVEVIDLGDYGKLIAPVQVDGGSWFYYWDRSGDGSNANSGSLNGGVDYTTHDVLDGIFNQDLSGNTGGGGNTDNTYRYATLNGVHLALPTAGGANPAQPYGASGIDNYQPGTAIGSSPASTGSNAVNSTYNDYLAIWDAYNGTGTGININGAPAGWQADSYWSATPSPLGHADVYRLNGYVHAFYDYPTYYVALQVLFSSSIPVITSGTTASFAEKPTGTVYTATATDVDVGATLSYSMSGVDAGLFNLNTATGAVTFKVAPNFEVPSDVGGNNVYDISVSASDGSQSSAAQSVAITVTDVVVESFAGQSVIDLGSYGKLIAPVQVDGGNWFYYWDRSGDGYSGYADYATHDVLDGIFNQDIAGVVGGGSNTDNNYRYATLNGVHLALPTLGGQSSPPYGANGISANQPGTSVGSLPTTSDGSNAVNSTYNDLLAVWDAYNGTGTGTSINGTPAGWQTSGYWSATPSVLGHAIVGSLGNVVDGYDDAYRMYVALQVL